MVKMRLCSRDEFNETFSAVDYEYYFNWELLCPTFAETEEIPFRDAETIRLLREIYEIEFINDVDWYSVRCEGTRMNIWCLNKGLKFAMVAIYMSRQGRYTWFEDADEKIWKVLSDLPFDVLVGMEIRNMGVCCPRIEGIDYKIENYPWNGQTYEVNVLESGGCLLGDNYKRMDETRKYGTGESLYLGQDGKYYTASLAVNHSFQFIWKAEIEAILKHIDFLKKDKVYFFEDIRRSFDIFEMSELLGEDINCFEGDCEPLESSEEYVYFKEKFKIITHMRTLPRSPMHRKLPMLMVDKNRDGSYFIHGCLTVKNTYYNEMLEGAIDRRSNEKEIFILIVDVEELLYKAEDIDETLCGFKVQADSVEMYEAYEAIQLFGEALREAYYSSKCNIDIGFY